MSNIVSVRKQAMLFGALAGLALLSACGSKKDENDLSALDAQLTNRAADPAVRAAVEDKITVDPDLVAQSNRNQLRPSDRPGSGAVPTGTVRKPAAGEPEKLAGGQLQQAPAPQAATKGTFVTLGDLATAQQIRDRACMKVMVEYDNVWAQRMPSGMPLYPASQLVEAAGGDAPKCNLRAVSFNTGAAIQDVMNFYYTLAARAGLSGARSAKGEQQILGGSGQKGAYYVMAEPLRGGGSAVDLVVIGSF